MLQQGRLCDTRKNPDTTRNSTVSKSLEPGLSPSHCDPFGALASLGLLLALLCPFQHRGAPEALEIKLRPSGRLWKESQLGVS